MKRRLRRVYVRLLRAPGAPGEIAFGMAIGLFVALFPIAQTPIALGIVEIFRRTSGIRASHLAAALGTWLTNPLTFVPLYGLSLLVGRPLARLVLGAVGLSHLPDIEVASVLQALRAGELFDGATLEGSLLTTALSFGMGNLIVGLPIALLGYVVTRRVVARYQERRAQRRLVRRAASS